ncbi:MAG: hypothetical protein AB1486_17015 [Planctomycetota bacterium]
MLPEKSRFTRRVTFIIDDQGILRHADGEVKAESHGHDLVEVVRKLQG